MIEVRKRSPAAKRGYSILNDGEGYGFRRGYKEFAQQSDANGKKNVRN
jgi:hypothetical protein